MLSGSAIKVVPEPVLLEPELPTSALVKGEAPEPPEPELSELEVLELMETPFNTRPYTPVILATLHPDVASSFVSRMTGPYWVLLELEVVLEEPLEVVELLDEPLE